MVKYGLINTVVVQYNNLSSLRSTWNSTKPHHQHNHCAPCQPQDKHVRHHTPNPSRPASRSEPPNRRKPNVADPSNGANRTHHHSPPVKTPFTNHRAQNKALHFASSCPHTSIGHFLHATSTLASRNMCVGKVVLARHQNGADWQRASQVQQCIVRSSARAGKPALVIHRIEDI